MNSRFDRRTFLAGVGASSLLLPMLDVTRERARAATAAKRLIVIAVPNGVREDLYWPTGGETNFSLKAGSPLRALQDHLDDIIFMGGLTLKNGQDSNNGGLGGHAALPFLLTGARGVPGPTISDGVTKSASFPSVDQYIAKKIGEKTPLPFESLVLRPLNHGGNDVFLSFNGAPLDPSTPNVPTPRVDPAQIYQDLFSGASLDGDRLARLRLERRSVLDFVSGRLSGFAKRLGQEDRLKIEAHSEAIRRVEKQLDTLTGQCAAPTLPGEPPGYLQENGNPNLPSIIRSQIDLTVAAMACDATRVASMLWSSSHNIHWVFSWLGDEYTVPTDYFGGGENGGRRNHHEIAHKDGEAPFTDMMNRCSEWYLEQLAYLIQRMKETPDVEGKTLFDNTAILFTNLQRTGGGHNTDNLPWILAGSCGGYFKTGRFLPWPGGKTGQSVPQNGVLTALCNAMDVPMDYYGEQDYGGELSSLRG